ncbi:MAG TPA: response regulator [Phototrophicaceae bacterium]|jgi:CheY-like chemotaxis protein|nr:response regulator [Phototrophicaceae bacterium]
MLLKDRHIFIVEDNLQNRVIFQMALIRQGAHVSFERWGRDTMMNLKGAPFIHLIILDLMLADNISGFDVYDEIRANPRFAMTPILAVSAMEPAVAIPQAKAKGFSGFIAKPIDDQRFPIQIASVIEGQYVWYAGERTL